MKTFFAFFAFFCFLLGIALLIGCALTGVYIVCGVDVQDIPLWGKILNGATSLGWSAALLCFVGLVMALDKKLKK